MAKRKEKVVEKETYTVGVLVDAYTQVTRHATEPQWDRDDTSTSHTVRGIQYPPKDRYHSVDVGFEPEYGVPYHLVWAQYSTGDSFGRDDGSGVEIVGLYTDRKVAEENVRRIEEHSNTYTVLNRSCGMYGLSKEEKAEMKKLQKTFDSYSIKLLTDDGREYQIHVPWNGYFESLDFVEVEAVMLR